MAKFKKGNPGGPGRPKGATNEKLRVTREWFQKFCDDNAAEVTAAWLEVRKKDPARAVELFTKMAEYCMPKLQRTELAAGDGGALTVNVITLGADGS